METLDNPAPLKFNNGNLAPINARIVVFVFLILAVLFLINGSYIIGTPLLLIFLATTFNENIIVIDEGKNLVRDYTSLIGFINIGKRYKLDEYKYITGVPLVESMRIYSRTNNSTVVSNNYTAVALFKDRLRGKLILTKFETKSEADEVAQKIAHRLGIKYFEYDPQLIRSVLRGQKTL